MIVKLLLLMFACAHWGLALKHYPPYLKYHDAQSLTQMILMDNILLPEYDEQYQSFLNTSASEALSKPQLAINAANNYLDRVTNNTKRILGLINDNCVCYLLPCLYCDDVIFKEIEKDPALYKADVEVLFAAGEFAIEFNANIQKFQNKSNLLAAHEYVIKGANDLKNLAFKLADVYRLTNFLSC